MKTRNVLLIGAMLMSLVFFNSCEEEVRSPNSTSEAEAQAELATYFTLAGNAVRILDLEDQEEQIRAMALGGLSPAVSGIETVDYKGAISPLGDPWYAGWSFYDAVINGDMKSKSIPELPVEVITDDRAKGVGTTTWTNDKIWILDGIVFVNRGDVLTIEPGTIIQGRNAPNGGTSSLIISRGAKIIAEGTAEEPIIFTFEGDQGNTSPEVRGKWGGLVLLGDATLNNDLGINSAEGLSPADSRAYFGGFNDADNSGVLRYISIRHCGAKTAQEDNDINGLTLGAVGSGTTIENVEVVGSLDDGIEWFGGTVNSKRLISAYSGDDGIDTDLGFRGINQYIVIYKSGDKGSEHDGGDSPINGLPFAKPIFYNVTSIGINTTQALTFRDNTGGEYHNSLFINYAKGADIELVPSDDFHSYRQFVDENLKIENNSFFNIEAGDLPGDVLKVKLK
ncbi:MAG: carboxypeptidase regulatory-like domain-containing protein [Bacteroidota bacterium]